MPGYNAWVKKASGDLKSAMKLVKDDDDTLDTAVYHTQQCAEKILKAYLIFKKQRVPHTHDLEKILELCCQHDLSFKSLLNDALDLLPYAIYSRYPDDRFCIDREEALQAIKKAKTILNFTKKKIEALPDPNQTIF
jgi:HEPN domain-containing protein